VTTLITGASGFIGGRLAERLIANGEDVRVMARNRSRLPNSITSNAEVIEGDLTHPESLTAAVAGIEVVYHCAANVHTWDTWENYQSANVTGVRNLLEAITRKAPDLRRLVHLSTVDVYGYPDTPCDEASPLDAGGFGYGESKLQGEKLIRDSGLPWTILRPANVYGPGSPFVWRIADTLKAGPMVLISHGRAHAGLLYIDNLVDWMRWSSKAPAAIKECFNVRDDNDVTWARYIDRLKVGIEVRGRLIDLPFPVADVIAKTLSTLYRLGLPGREPILHPLLVRMFGRTCGHSAAKIWNASGMRGDMGFEKGMARSLAWYSDQAR
jgi:nucleoside-diphosphate-sugar epimerase